MNSLNPHVLATERPHYELLDGLRGVAALLVILYHFGEGFATSPVDQFMNHGYLAVDFFFVLSGFVLGYAYDGRWSMGLTSRGFMLRRVIRLHPMVILSVAFGAIAYLIQGSVKWDGSPVAVEYLLLALVLGLFLIPILPQFCADVRGNGEMFPLNGPSWSLFFEYVGSILYACWLHRLGRKALMAIIAVSGIGLATCAFANVSGGYSIGFGWSAAGWGFAGGFFRLSFSFAVGLLMSRVIRPRNIRGAFWISAALIALLLSCPYFGADSGQPSPYNAIYDLVCTFVFFPAIIYVGASGNTTYRFSTSTCNMLGRISYPIYMVHYPLMYLFYSWVWSNGVTVTQAVSVCAAIFVVIVVLAWTVMKFYDEPVRRWLSRCFLK